MKKFCSIFMLMISLLTINLKTEQMEVKRDNYQTRKKKDHYILPLEEKHTTIMIYMASDNDLNYFAQKNLSDMKKIGSNENFNIIVQVDGQGPYEKVKRYYVAKDQLIQINKYDLLAEKLDFGSAKTLADFCIWSRKNFKAQHYVLILWDHGIGILDSIGGKTSHVPELFIFNQETNLIEINRNINFIEYLQKEEIENLLRGICFSDTFGTYLTNQKLISAMDIIKNECDNKKFDIIAFDACLMGMIEVADLLKPYAEIMVASQELELGAGYPYHKMFEPFLTQTLTPKEFASHMVKVYGDHYKTITQDYTQSAVNLTNLDLLEEALEKTTQLLLKALQHQQENSVSKLIKTSKSRRICTCFSEPTYIDLYDFLKNLEEATDYMNLEKNYEYLKNLLKTSLSQTKDLIDKIVIANAVGKNLLGAKGLSIYFPSKLIDPSYIQTPFVKNFSWINLIRNTML